MAVVRAIVAMAAAMSLDTVAEGVEEDAQLLAVKELGCDRVQGFLLARPMALASLVDYYACEPAATEFSVKQGADRFRAAGLPS